MIFSKFEKLNRKFTERLKELEDEYKDLFINENQDKSNSILDHYVLIVRSDDRVCFSFKPESQLPDFFKEICKKEYKKIFLNRH